jgi:hypothetical protein
MHLKQLNHEENHEETLYDHKLYEVEKYQKMKMPILHEFENLE